MFAQTSLREPALSSASQAGLVNNLDDGQAWGLFPVLFAGGRVVGRTHRHSGGDLSSGDVAHPSWRARSVGVYRLWRDGAFAVGALLAGVIADFLGLRAAVWFVAALTAASGTLVAVRMYETRRPRVPRGTTKESRHGRPRRKGRNAR